MATLRVQRQVAPGQQQGNFNAPVSQGAELASRDLQQLGNQVQQTAQVAAGIWTKEQTAINEARVNDALNRVQRFGSEQQGEYSQLQGENAMKADDLGRPVAVVYGEKFDQQIGTVADELELTPFQRQLYERQAGLLSTRFRASAQDYEVRQTEVYMDQVETGGIAAEQETLALYPSSDAGAISRARIQELGEARGERLGWTPEATRLFIQAETGKPLLAALKALSDTNVDEAEAFFDANRESMTASQRGEAEAVLRPARQYKIAEAAASSVAPQLGATISVPGAPSDFSTSMNMIWPSEGSAFVAEDNGAGRARYGITESSHPEAWADGDVTQAEAEAIYKRDYWDKIGGDDLPAGLAHMAFDTAINMGEPTAQRLLRESGGDIARFAELRRQRYRRIAANDPDGSSQRYLSAWLARADRVEREATGQSDATPTRQLTMTETQAVAAARAALPPGAPPELVRQTEQLVRQRYQDFDRAEAETFEAAQTAAFEHIERTKTMPTESMLAALKPGTRDSVVNYFQALTAPPTQRSDDLTLMALTADLSWMDMDYTEFVGAYHDKLSPSDLRQHVAQLTKSRTAAGTEVQTQAASALVVPSESFSRALNSRLDLRGIDRTDLPDADKQQRALLVTSLRSAILQAQRVKGSQLTEGEIGALVDERLGALTWERPGGMFGMGRATDVTAVDYDTMSGDNRREARERLRAIGNTSPSEADVFENYLMTRVNGATQTRR